MNLPGEGGDGIELGDDLVVANDTRYKSVAELAAHCRAAESGAVCHGKYLGARVPSSSIPDR